MTLIHYVLKCDRAAPSLVLSFFFLFFFTEFTCNSQLLLLHNKLSPKLAAENRYFILLMSFSVRKLDRFCGVILVPCDCVKCPLGLESSEGSTGLDVLTHMLAIVPGSWEPSHGPTCGLFSLVVLWLYFLHYGSPLRVSVPRAPGGS